MPLVAIVLAHLTDPVEITLFARIIIDGFAIFPLVAITLDIPNGDHAIDTDCSRCPSQLHDGLPNMIVDSEYKIANDNFDLIPWHFILHSDIGLLHVPLEGLENQGDGGHAVESHRHWDVFEWREELQTQDYILVDQQRIYYGGFYVGKEDFMDVLDYLRCVPNVRPLHSLIRFPLFAFLHLLVGFLDEFSISEESLFHARHNLLLDRLHQS